LRIRVPEITVPDGPSKPPYPQPEPAVAYNRPMTKELAIQLLTEQYEIKKIDEDVMQSKAVEYLETSSEKMASK
jgi:hypothetical protein